MSGNDVLLNKNMLSGMDPLLTLSGDEFAEVVKRSPDGTYKNYRVLVSKLRAISNAYEFAVSNGFEGSLAQWLDCTRALYALDESMYGKVLMADAKGMGQWVEIDISLIDGLQEELDRVLAEVRLLSQAAATSASAASQSAQQSAAAVTATNAAKLAAQGFADNAHSAALESLASRDAAEGFASDAAIAINETKGYMEQAVVAKDGAIQSASQAATSATQAGAAKDATVSFATEAGLSATLAVDSKNAAASSAQQAVAAKDAAVAIADDIAGSVVEAQDSAAAAIAAKDAAVIVAAAAQTSATEAETAKTAAEGFATQSTAARDAAEGFAVDALGAVGETQDLVLQANIAKDAAQAAVTESLAARDAAEAFAVDALDTLTLNQSLVLEVATAKDAAIEAASQATTARDSAEGFAVDALASVGVTQNLAMQADTAKDAAQAAATQSLTARDSSESFAADSLAALTLNQGLTVEAQQAALEAADSAAAAAEVSESTLIELAANGGPLIGVVQPVGPSMTIGEYLLRNKLMCLTGDMLQAFIDFASSSGGRDVTLVPNLVYEMGLTKLEIKPGVELKTDGGNAMSVQHVVTNNLRGLATLRFGAISTDAVLVRSTAFNNSLHSFIIDNALQISGHGIHCDDSDGVQRVGTRIRNVFVYKRGNGAGLWVKPGHKEGSAHEVFVRNGIGVATGTDAEKLAQLAGDGEYGVVMEAVDWDSNRILCGFARKRGFLYTGGACRFRDMDVWGSQDINAELLGSSITIDRLQVDGAGNGGLLVNGGDDVVINKLISINNCLTATVPTDDIIIRGECRSLSFDQVRLRGSSGNIRYGIAMEDTATGIGNIGDLNFASSYLDGMDDRARAYISVSATTNALSPARGHSRHIENLTVNPLFTKWTAAVPDGFTVRGSAVPTQIVPAGMTTGKYLSGCHIVSGAVGVSGIQVILDKDKYKGRRIYCGGWFKGSGLTYLGNQRIQLFDGANTFVEIIPNDNQWHWIAIDKQMDINATDVQIRLVAANDTTTGLLLDMTAVYYWAY